MPETNTRFLMKHAIFIMKHTIFTKKYTIFIMKYTIFLLETCNILSTKIKFHDTCNISHEINIFLGIRSIFHETCNRYSENYSIYHGLWNVIFILKYARIIVAYAACFVKSIIFMIKQICIIKHATFLQNYTIFVFETCNIYHETHHSLINTQ